MQILREKLLTSMQKAEYGTLRIRSPIISSSSTYARLQANWQYHLSRVTLIFRQKCDIFILTSESAV